MFFKVGEPTVYTMGPPSAPGAPSSCSELEIELDWNPEEPEGFGLGGSGPGCKLGFPKWRGWDGPRADLPQGSGAVRIPQPGKGPQLLPL